MVKTLSSLAAVVLIALVAAPVAAAKQDANPPPSDGDYYLGFHAPAADVAPRGGVVMTLHGGGWKGDLGPAADQVMELYIEDLTGWGFPVYNLGYQSGRESLRDTLDAVRRVSKAWPERPLCLLGGSAGAHLALIAAAELPGKIDCVAALGAPPNLVDPDVQPMSSDVPALAAAAFGADRLKKLSPINRVEEIIAPVLVVASDCDAFTSLHRQQRFVDRLPNAQMVVELGVQTLNATANWLTALLAPLTSLIGVETGHCRVTKASFDAFRQAELAFLAAHAG